MAVSIHNKRSDSCIREKSRMNSVWWGKVSQARNIIYLYCLEVQAGFNRDVIECSSFIQETRARIRAGDVNDF